MMDSPTFESYVADIKRRTHGRWTEVLRALGVEERILNRHNQPCPLCGGTDRFQYTDKYGDGNYYCRGCGPGGGLKLLQAIHGWTFSTVLHHVEDYIGRGATSVPACPRSTGLLATRMKQLAERIWNEARPVRPGDEVDRYLCRRGLSLGEYPDVLRCHPALGYYEKNTSGSSRKVGEHAAMLACIQGSNGQLVTLHRTYLENAAKLQRGSAKKVLSGGISGAAVRLFKATDELAIAEGIETALAIYLATNKPVWAAVNAANMEKLWLPETVRRVWIYSDNDANTGYAGQAYAYALARRLKKGEKTSGHRDVEVFVPRHSGSDWADVWLSHSSNTLQAA